MEQAVIDYTRTIYKKDSSDRIRFLKVSASSGELILLSGLLDGKSVERRSMCKAKNVGRSNETTPEEQAILEAKAKIVQKLKEGYFDTKELAEKATVILPMLAKSYDNESHKIKWGTGIYVQPKFDGMRCLTVVNSEGEVTLISRKNTPIETMDHIIEDIKALGIKDIIFDGELYAHGYTFQENMKLIKKRRDESINVKYHIYDIVDEKCSYDGRLSLLRSLFFNNMHGTQGNELSSLEPVDTQPIMSESALKYYHAKWLNEGYEGTMIRIASEGYAINKRSSSLLKYKDFLDETYEVVDVVPSDRDPSMGVVECQKGNATFRCGMKFSHGERRRILQNKQEYIGQKAEIRYFELTDDGLPRFPVCVGFRLDK